MSIYEVKTRVTYYDLDCKNTLKPSALLRMANIAAEQNATDLGIGYTQMEPLSLAFVLQRFCIYSYIAPKYNQDVYVRTWPGEIIKGMFNRYGEMLDMNRVKMMEWISQWVLLDLRARKILRPTELPVTLPVYGNLGVSAAGKKIEQLDKEAFNQLHHSFVYTVRYSDLDTNLHMNNAVYGNLIADALCPDANSEIVWQNMLINFLAETRIGETINVSCIHAGDSYRVNGTVEGKPVFAAAVDAHKKNML